MTNPKRPTKGTPRLEGGPRKRRNHLFLAMFPWCSPCAAKGIRTKATIVDHIVALINGGPETRDPDLTILEPYCNDCHCEKTASDLGRTSRKVRFGTDANGNSLDPNDPWYEGPASRRVSLPNVLPAAATLPSRGVAGDVSSEALAAPILCCVCTRRFTPDEREAMLRELELNKPPKGKRPMARCSECMNPDRRFVIA